jgi:hypothetical protein
MSYAPIVGPPLKVRYGTAVEPWHSLSLFYHYDTPLPAARDYTRSSRTGLGQGEGSYTSLIYGTLAATFAAGALTMHLMHRYHVLGMNRRVRRNRRHRRH